LILRAKGPNPDWQVDFFHAFDNEKLAQVKTIEPESVMAWHLDELRVTVPNLYWIVPMAFSHKNDHVGVNEVIEKETFAA
jgi:hypothetical protein